ncbi:molybdopterin converting factor subunit 1 [Urechidicola sp. KH5]
MQVRLLAFGITSDILGAINSFELEQGQTVGDLRNALEMRFPKLQSFKNYAIAVNENYAENAVQLSENDTVALIPPVSGG